MTSAGDDRKQKRKILKSLLGIYFNLDKEGHMTLVDDPSTTVKGADWRKIINFLVPAKNIHPKAKPDSFAPVVDVLRDNDIFNLDFYPNNSLEPHFNQYGKKATKYTDRIRSITQAQKTAQMLTASLAENGDEHWESFS